MSTIGQSYYFILLSSRIEPMQLQNGDTQSAPYPLVVGADIVCLQQHELYLHPVGTLD